MIGLLIYLEAENQPVVIRLILLKNLVNYLEDLIKIVGVCFELHVCCFFYDFVTSLTHNSLQLINFKFTKN